MEAALGKVAGLELVNLLKDALHEASSVGLEDLDTLIADAVAAWNLATKLVEGMETWAVETDALCKLLVGVVARQARQSRFPELRREDLKIDELLDRACGVKDGAEGWCRYVKRQGKNTGEYCGGRAVAGATVCRAHAEFELRNFLIESCVEFPEDLDRKGARRL